MKYAKLSPKLSAFKVAVLPLQKNLNDKASEIYARLKKEFYCDYDDAGSIGKRYRRHDEIGTPYCITVDFDTLENGTVTLRDRDSMEQQRMTVDEVISFVNEKLKN